MVNITCFAAVAVIAARIAKAWILNWSPTDIVASNKNDGSGTKGINEPKKVTKLKPKYPISGAKGKRAAKSTKQCFYTLYLTIKKNHGLENNLISKIIKISYFVT